MYQTNTIELDHVPPGTVTSDIAAGKFQFTVVTGGSSKTVLVIPFPVMQELLKQVAACTPIAESQNHHDENRDHILSTAKGELLN